MPSAMNAKSDYEDFCAYVAERYKRLSKQQKIIARFMMENPVVGALESAVEIAKRLGFPPSSMTRFAKALDMESFSSIQRVYRKRLVDFIPSGAGGLDKGHGLAAADSARTAPGGKTILEGIMQVNQSSLVEFGQSVDQTRIEAATSRIIEARNVYILGHGVSFPMASYLFNLFWDMDLLTHLLGTGAWPAGEQLKKLGAGDLLLLFTFPDYALEIIGPLNEARDRGATIITVTDHPISPAIDCSDIHFLTDRMTHRGCRSIAGSMYLAQVLATGVGLAKEGMARSVVSTAISA